MCGGPSKAEREAAAEAQRQQSELAAAQRQAIDEAERAEAERRAAAKQEDIQEAVQASTVRRRTRGGSGRRSLFTAGGGGFMGRFS
jgi:hypothetical protein